jgi:hypothetical protein
MNDWMLRDVVSVDHPGGYRLRLRFDDGAEGEVDLAHHLDFHGVFAPLKDLDYFSRVQVDPDGGTITWPNEANVDPVVLYSWVTGQPIPHIE